MSFVQGRVTCKIFELKSAISWNLKLDWMRYYCTSEDCSHIWDIEDGQMVEVRW